jgi:hypothetical protein
MAFCSRKLFPLFFVCIPMLAADASLWRFVHPKSKALVGIQWSTVQKSEVGRWIQERWINGESIPGMEFLPDIQEALISSPGPASDAPNADPPLLIAIRGHFDLARVQQLLVRQGHRAQSFGTVSIYRPIAKGSTEPSFALLSSEIILVGDLQSLYATIERSRLPVSEDDDEGFLGRAQLLATRYDCWAIMSEPGAMKNFLFASLAGKTISPDSLGFEAGISVKDGLSIDLVLNSRSERGARTACAKLTRLLKVNSGGPEYAALFQKLRITSDHTSVFISLKMNPQETAASLKIPAAPPVPVVEAAHAAENKVIRIEGLDEGVREVVVKPR